MFFLTGIEEPAHIPVDDDYLPLKIVFITSEKEYAYKAQILADFVFGKKFAKRYHNFTKRHIIKLMMSSAFLFFVGSFWHMLHSLDIARIIISIGCFIFIISLVFNIHIDIVLHMMKDFYVLFLIMNVTCWIFCSLILALEDSPGSIVNIGILCAHLWLYFILAIFIDAIPMEVFPSRIRKYFWAMTFLVYITYLIKLSFFEDSYEIIILGQTWILSDIRASSSITITMFAAKILICSIRYPNSMILCTAR